VFSAPGGDARVIEVDIDRLAAERPPGEIAPLVDTDGVFGEIVEGEPSDIARLEGMRN
jgi:hypothetical protein